MVEMVAVFVAAFVGAAAGAFVGLRLGAQRQAEKHKVEKPVPPAVETEEAVGFFVPFEQGQRRLPVQNRLVYSWWLGGPRRKEQEGE
jgi:hypothetical protein